MSDEHYNMEFRRKVNDLLSDLVQTIPENEETIITGWVLITEVAAPNDNPNSIGPEENVYGFCSAAGGDFDAAPWKVEGWLSYGLNHFDDLFLGEEDEEEDD